ncbi:MAG: PEGA domain-containing protein [Archangium sp.]
MLPLLLLVLAAPKGAAAAAPAKPPLPAKAAVFSTDSTKEGELKSALEGADVPLLDVAEAFPVPPIDDSGLKLVAAAKQLYDDLDYEGSAAKWSEALEFFVKTPDAADSKSLADAHFFTAVLAIQNGGKSQAKKAQEEFARALLFNPDLTCDPQVYGNDVKKAFDKALADVNGRPTATLTIESKPSGADIQVRGKKMGQTPFTDGTTVPIGRHLVTLSKPGYGTVGVFADVSREGGSVKPELKAAGEFAGVIDGATNAINKGVGQKGPLPGNARKIGEVIKARFLVMSDGATAEVWDLDTGNRLAGLSMSSEELSVTAKKISDFIAKPGSAAIASAKGDTPGVEEPGAMGPVYKQWWFWTAVGVVAVGAGTAVGVAAANNSGPRPFNVVLGLP